MNKGSWQLKSERAGQHLKELDSALSKYESTRPYNVVPKREPKRQTGNGVRPTRLHVHVREEPDPYIGVIVGDVLYELRCALDHVAVAVGKSSRRSKTSFPLLDKDPWEIDLTTGAVREDEALELQRQKFASRTRGIPEAALTIIKGYQPYVDSDGVERHALGFLNTFQNEDKHRGLVVLSHSIKDPQLTVRMSNGDFYMIAGVGEFEDGAPVVDEMVRYPGAEGLARALSDGSIFDPQVDMKVSGAVQVAVKSRATGDEFPIPATLRQVEGVVRDVLADLTPFL